MDIWTTTIKLSNACDCDDQHNEIHAFKLYINTTQMIFCKKKKYINFSQHKYACNVMECYIPLIKISLWLQCALFHIHEK